MLWKNPLVLYAECSGETARLLPLPAGTLVLLALYWSAEDGASSQLLARQIGTWRARCPGVRFVVLANSRREVEILGELGVEVSLVNHNAFIDTEIFRPQLETETRYDAIYDAQPLPYKRHYLAAKIPRLALISYINRPSPDLAYARAIRRELSGATWLNDPLVSDYRRMNLSEVATALNMARCGLCLSASEGAMYASCQYLLCGLPVVTTPSLGGRDYFFEDDFVVTVEPTADAVAAGVASLLRRPIDRDLVRGRTLAKIEVLRARFVALVQGHLDRHAPGSDFAGHFKKIFFHTLLRKEKAAWLRTLRANAAE